jgi:DNA-binding response OmpR family regulator
LAEPEKSTSNLPIILEDLFARAIQDPTRKRVSLITEAPAHFPAVAVEAKRITSLLGELVENVLAWTMRQEILIQAYVVPTSSLPGQLDQSGDPNQEGPWALISISDQHAPQLREEDRSEVMKPEHVEVQHTLEVLQQEIGRQGGDLWFETAEGEAIQIWVTLPLHADHSDRVDVERIKDTIDSRLSESPQTTAKLLVQAESDELRGRLVESLIEGGYDVISTRRSSEVFSLARREVPGLFILDLQSRAPGAMDLAIMLQGDPQFSRLPILFLTEIAGPGIGRRMDTVDFIIQPEGSHAILHTVNQVLQKGLQPAQRIMVVESDDSLREQMLQTIQGQGYPVVEARSAEEALALAERLNLGVILAQARLAEERDFWLVRQLRQLSEEIEIYLMTEGDQSVDARLALRKGATGYGDTGRLRELLARVEDDEDETGD